MRTFSILLLSCCIATLSHAGSKDSLSTVTENFHSFQLAAPLPVDRFARPVRYVSENKLRRKLRMSNGMLFAGGGCLLAAVPVFIAANNSYDKSPSYGSNRVDDTGGLLLTMGGALLACAGVGLVIPGAILHSKYKRQLANH